MRIRIQLPNDADPCRSGYATLDVRKIFTLDNEGKTIKLLITLREKGKVNPRI
jgi:hypothetical protein